MSVFEKIEYDAIFQRIKAEFLQRSPEFTALLESDPAIKLLEIAAYQEMLMRFRIQEAIKSNLLAYAAGQDLDNLAEFYSVQRAENPLNGTETDESFRTKIKARIQAWSPAGSRDHYKFHTLQADSRVKDARADSPAPGLVRIAVLSTENNGLASPDLLEKVTEIITSDSVRVLTDTVEVVGCTIVPIALEAAVTLHPETPQGVLITAKTKLETAFEGKKSLGWNVSKSWLIANLFVDGIQNITLTSPTADIAIADDACAALTNVTLTFGGRQW
jgi:phage-related baseplate assembly protein